MVMHLLPDNQDVANCCLVNTAWSKVANPVLWRRPKFNSFSAAKAFLEFAKKYQEPPPDSKLRLVRILDLRRSYSLEKLLDRFPNIQCLYLPRRPLNFSYETLHFPQLKKIRNVRLDFEDCGYSQLSHIFRQCPLLEELSVDIKEKPNQGLTLPLPIASRLTSLSITWDGFEYWERIEERAPLIIDFIRAILKALVLPMKHFSLKLEHPVYSDPNQPEKGHFLQLVDGPWSELRSLELDGVELDALTLPHLTQVLPTDLTSLKLAQFYPPKQPVSLAPWEQLIAKCGKSLTSLYLINDQLPEHIERAIGDSCPQLRNLILMGSNLNDHCVSYIIEKAAKSLEYMEIEAVLTSRTLETIFHYCQLKVLNLESFDPDTRPTYTMPPKEFFSQLENLSLYGFRVQTPLLEGILQYGKRITKLVIKDHETLEVSKLKTVVEGLPRLKEFEFCQPLLHLDGRTEIMDLMEQFSNQT
ncbi:hypothetical protein K493DRAFT_313441 [Basidiobolus meristosporus CBS 931.73]|uniref:F-box domain-containing protein n=1 Tax=Basidiobolus meristosporus CBS 931.73 TaxID=1314790 RepID=A0A1Y1YLM8_9FUNG|nr:hypothetical protein K493DRAFT_313441 [Basidiobolus meristosporus CBS 931.73]|eukprot:ORX98905.1 hypothetical protein K493DRAFT_313441 [Basidiobolus meristosporus CBS 931.73]